MTGAAARRYGEAMETTREYRTGSDSRTLRDALGCFATGVTVVTCLDAEGDPIGLTANSFTAVSLDPPLLLVCVAKAAASLDALSAAPHFAVNVLQTGQEPESITFSTRIEDRFGRTRWALGEHGVPQDIYDEVRAQLSEQEISDLTFAVMAINGWNRLSIAFCAVPGSKDAEYGLAKAGLS